MAKNSIRDYANTAASNTDVQGQNVDEGCSPAGINNAIREVMADLADVNDGTISLVSPDFDAATINSVAIDAFASGTKMLFQQTAAPTGWTKDTTHNDKALRVVTGSVSSGGTNSFSTSFASYTPAGTNAVTIASHPLALSEIPSHSHTGKVYLNAHGTVSAISDSTLGTTINHENSGHTTSTTTSYDLSGVTRGNNTGGGGGHTHSGSTAVFTGTASTQFAVQYVDVIVATKD